MSRNYSQSTIDVIGDLKGGLRVETPTFLNATYIKVAEVNLFVVSGLIRLFYYGVEAITAWSADATTIKFSYNATTPAIAVVDLCAASGALGNLAIGKRVAVLGDALATGALESANSGVSLQTYPLDIGCYGGAGYLTITGAAAAQTGATATSKAVVLYVPLSDGAYVESAI
jgi:hypothetical protein